jgi:hypothetical protein
MSDERETQSGWWQASDGLWYPPEAKWTHAEDAYLAAAHLAKLLRGGGRPTSLTVPIVLAADEQAYHVDPFTQYKFAASNVSYNSGWVAAFGSPLWLAASLGGSALYNKYQRDKARAEAAAQWRVVNYGTAFLTDRRLCLQGQLAWVDIAFSTVRALEPIPEGVVIYQANQPPTMVSTPAVAYLYVLLSFLVNGRVIDVPLPHDLVSRARAAGKRIP